MKQRGELASEPDEESDQDDIDEGMRSDTVQRQTQSRRPMALETRRRRWEKGGSGSARQRQWKALA
jgi:hypothetical protein